MEQRGVELPVSEKLSLLQFCLMTQETHNKDMSPPPPPAVFQLIQTLTHGKLTNLTRQSFLLILANLDQLFKKGPVLKFSIFWKAFSAPLQ